MSMGQAPLRARTPTRNFFASCATAAAWHIRHNPPSPHLRVSGFAADSPSGYPLAVKASSINSFTCSTPAISRDVSAWVSPLAVVRTNVAVLIGKAELKTIVITTIMPPAIPT
jgi:hypothetical protein